MISMKKLYIDAGTVIVNLLNEEKSRYLTIEKIEKLVNYIYEQLFAQGYFNYYQDIIFNVNFDAIERTVWFNNYVFDLIGNTIFLKDDYLPKKITEKYKTDNCVEQMIKDFVENAA